MRVIYRFEVEDYYGNVQEIKLRGPDDDPTNYTTHNTRMNSFKFQLDGIINGFVRRMSYAYEIEPTVPTIDAQSTNKLSLELAYLDGNSDKKRLVIPSPDLSQIQFLAGDIVDLTETETSQVLWIIENQMIDEETGASIDIDSGVLTGQE